MFWKDFRVGTVYELDFGRRLFVDNKRFFVRIVVAVQHYECGDARVWALDYSGRIVSIDFAAEYQTAYLVPRVISL